jgi:hypothetical protein
MDANNYRSAIIELYARLGIEPTDDSSGFGCKYFKILEAAAPPAQRKECSRNRSLCCGTWPYVGLCYGVAMVSAEKRRILFVAMDRGSDCHETAFEDTQQAFQRGAELRGNPHMGGVALIMAGLLDQGHTSGYARQFALTNAVKCVPAEQETMAANLDPIMIGNCANHLWSEIEIFRPNLIVTQGAHPRDTLLGHYSNLKIVAEFRDGPRSAQLCRSDSLVLLITPHPARQKGLKWKRGALGLGQGSIPDYLENALRRTRAELAS